MGNSRTQPTESSVKRLAVQATISEEQYGAGTVEIWDKAKYILKEREEDKLFRNRETQTWRYLLFGEV